MEKVLPRNLNYNQIKPVGYPSQIKQEKFTPVSFSSANMSDIIRFNINTNGFWDPYSAYIKIEVDTAGMDNVGLQCLDQSAHSFINQLIISNQGTELERIEEYDVLASVLVDMSYSPESRSARKFEGISSVVGISNDFKYTNPVFSVYQASNSQNIQFGYHSNYNIPVLNLLNSSNQNNSLTAYGANITTTWDFTNTIRYEKSLCYNSQTCVDSLLQSYQWLTQQPSGSQIGYEAPKSLSDYSLEGQVTQRGYQQAYNYSLSSGSNEDYLSPNYLWKSMYKGQNDRWCTKQKATYCIPLISGILGILMPQQSYKYVPMRALQQTILEFRLNPYAMFTSGYKDTLYSADVSTVDQIKRFWKITRFELNVEMQYFESQLENIILSQVNSDKGIILHSSSWQLGPRYQIGANTSPNGIYQVNLGFESLRNVIWMFLPDDYQTYNFCRKQYRISHNITQYYIKIGTDYYPSLPITGHAGNPQTYGTLASSNGSLTINNPTVDTDQNNSEFLIQLYKVFGRFNDITIDSFIDPVNFAVNERVYNPAFTGSLGNGSEFVNIHTAGGNPLFHEQRCVGKAVYALNLETLNNDFSVISGINTINNRPFELNLKSDSTNTVNFSRPSTMYVFCQFDLLLQIKSTGIKVLGRG